MKFAGENLDLQTLREVQPPEKEKSRSSSPAITTSHLLAKIQSLEMANKTLKERFEVKEQEVKRLKKEQAELLGVGLAGENAAARLVQLSRKNRDLTAELEAEKSRVRQLNRKWSELDRSRAESTVKKKESEAVKQTKEESKLECEKLQVQLAQAEAKVRELRNRCHHCKQDLKNSHAVLAKEVGDGISVSDLLKKPSGWRGRSQQILALQQKVQQLQQERKTDGEPPLGFRLMLSSGGLSRVEMGHRSKIKDLETKKKQSQLDLVKELDAVRMERDERVRQCVALKARSKTLAEDLKATRSQLALLSEKTSHDDEFIRQLAESKVRRRQMKGRMQEETLQCVDQRESGSRQLIEELKRQVEELKGRLGQPPSKCQSAPVVRKRGSSASSERTEHGNISSLYNAAEIERDRLAELVSMLTQEAREARNSALRAERRYGASLERSRKAQQQSSVNKTENLEMKLVTLVEENEALRRALAAADESRDRDLRVYQEMARQTREVFLQGIRRVKANMSLESIN
eukprot:m.86703 g.86703  ORF g.86703 m.86703 type:complete len:519 (+) comp36510_c0_seq12:137-1693(+)